MNRDTALMEVKKMLPDFLIPAKKIVNGHQTYICPVCGNGSGKTGDGIAFINDHYKCFKCGMYEDIIGLWKISQGIDNDLEAFNSCYAHYGIQVDDINPGDYGQQRHVLCKPALPPANSSPQEKRDFMPFYNECMDKINETDYLHSRGLSDKIIHEYMLGYDPHFRTINTDTGEREEWKAVIIPAGRDRYTVRNTDPAATKKNRLRKIGGSGLYRKRALTEAKKPIFIVEGELDALSIIEVGGEAVGLGSTANKGIFVQMLKTYKPSQILILALDNDENGERTSDELEIDLQKMNIPYIRTNIYGTKKDANEALVADRESFKKKIEEEERKCQ